MPPLTTEERDALDAATALLERIAVRLGYDRLDLQVTADGLVVLYPMTRQGINVRHRDGRPVAVYADNHVCERGTLSTVLSSFIEYREKARHR